MTSATSNPFPNGLLAFSTEGAALMLLQMVSSAAMRGLFGFTGWQRREHREPVSLTYITSVPLADEVSLYYISVLQRCKSCRGDWVFSSNATLSHPRNMAASRGLLLFSPSLKTFGFPLEGQRCWSRNCQWEMSWCVSWKGANKCHSRRSGKWRFWWWRPKMWEIFKVTPFNRVLDISIDRWLTQKRQASPQNLHKSASIPPEGEEILSAPLPPS